MGEIPPILGVLGEELGERFERNPLNPTATTV